MANAYGYTPEEMRSTGNKLTQVNNNLEPLGDFLIQYADAVVNMDDQMGAALRG